LRRPPGFFFGGLFSKKEENMMDLKRAVQKFVEDMVLDGVTEERVANSREALLNRIYWAGKAEARWHSLMVFLEIFGPLLGNPERVPIGVDDGRGHDAVGARDAYFRAKEARQLGAKLIEEAQMRTKSGM
jgi:hypothetical protein